MTAIAPRTVATGARVRLREKTVDDAARDYEWRRDPELATFDASRPLTLTLRAFASTMEDEIRFPTSYRRTFAIEALDGGRHIGNVMYYGYDERNGEAELGITIGDRDYWARGYGSDAVVTMLRFLFTEQGLRRVYLHTLTWNERAQRAFARAGFSTVRTVQRSGYDFLLMEVNHEQFAEQERQRVESGTDSFE